MVNGSLFLSVLVLISACLVLLYAVLAFAHVRITDADLLELERLRGEGLLPAQAGLIEDFDFVHARLSEVAPGVFLRQESWIRLYYYLLRLACWAHQLRQQVGACPGPVERELHRLSAYQAGHYRVALARLEALRNPIP